MEFGRQVSGPSHEVSGKGVVTRDMFLRENDYYLSITIYLKPKNTI